VVGVPLRTPDVERDKPAGKLPETRLQVKVGCRPPLAMAANV